MNDTLKIIADNQTLLDALKAVILKQFDLDGLSTQLADESLGQVVRARLEGLNKVEAAFKEILTYRTPSRPEVEGNPAR